MTMIDHHLLLHLLLRLSKLVHQTPRIGTKCTQNWYTDRQPVYSKLVHGQRLVYSKLKYTVQVHRIEIASWWMV